MITVAAILMCFNMIMASEGVIIMVKANNIVSAWCGMATIGFSMWAFGFNIYYWVTQ